jgi:hypothetical protein
VDGGESCNSRWASATSGHGQSRAWWGPAVSMIAHGKRFVFKDVVGLADHVLILACRSFRRIVSHGAWVRQLVEGDGGVEQHAWHTSLLDKVILASHNGPR